jgi:hypothetical protein
MIPNTFADTKTPLPIQYLTRFDLSEFTLHFLRALWESTRIQREFLTSPPLRIADIGAARDT